MHGSGGETERPGCPGGGGSCPAAQHGRGRRRRGEAGICWPALLPSHPLQVPVLLTSIQMQQRRQAHHQIRGRATLQPQQLFQVSHALLRRRGGAEVAAGRLEVAGGRNSPGSGCAATASPLRLGWDTAQEQLSLLAGKCWKGARRGARVFAGPACPWSVGCGCPAPAWIWRGRSRATRGSRCSRRAATSSVTPSASVTLSMSA